MAGVTERVRNEVTPRFLDLAWRSGLECLELEWRLGTYTSTGFHPGLTETQWQALRTKLDTMFPFIDIVTTERIVENVAWVSSTEGTWIKKKIRCFDYDAPPHVRISASTEHLQPVPQGTPVPTNVYTRYKERRSYSCDDCWSFDLTKVAVTSDVDCDTFLYEVEIELKNKDILFERPAWNVLAWGTDLSFRVLEYAGILTNVT